MYTINNNIRLKKKRSNNFPNCMNCEKYIVLFLLGPRYLDS